MTSSGDSYNTFVVLSGSGNADQIVALVHSDLHDSNTVSTLKQVADCIVSLCQRHTCRTLMKHQSGKPVITVRVVCCAYNLL